MSGKIRYLRNNEIDRVRWDQCIDTAANSRIYGYSYYLDTMARQWDGLVSGDYEAVMPLTWHRKWGFSYLYQPAFTAQLGIFGNGLNAETCHHFLAVLPEHFRLAEIELNPGNSFTEGEKGISARTNYVLSLNAPYESLASAYKENVKRNIRKAVQLQCTYKKDIPLNDIINLSSLMMGKVSNTNKDDYERFEKLFQLLQGKGNAITRGVYSMQEQLVASCVYFFSGQRAYYILVGNHPNGKTMGASHFLIDRFIEEFAGQPMLLDFEGSDLRNLAFFYSSFGAVTEIYPSLRINKLPWWVRLIKS